MLYVLTVLTKTSQNLGEPVAVVDTEEAAQKWIAEGKGHNWVPFELNDLAGVGEFTPFRPKPGSPAAYEEQKREQEHQQLEQMKGMVESLSESNKLLMKALKKRGITAQQLLTPVHKWGKDVSRGQDMVEQFAALMEHRSFSRGEQHECTVHPQC